MKTIGKYFTRIYQHLVPKISWRYLNSTYDFEFFDVQNHLDHAAAQKSYQLRHKVYCEELGFEQANANGFEKDQFDSSSIGCIVSHKNLQSSVAGLRLIRPNYINGRLTLPCLLALEKNYPNDLTAYEFDLSKSMEVSRLAIVNEFRHLKVSSDKKSLKLNYLLLALYSACVAMANGQHIENLIFMCENKMLAHFKK